jgi:superfamily II DNA or RNA helicase
VGQPVAPRHRDDEGGIAASRAGGFGLNLTAASPPIRVGRAEAFCHEAAMARRSTTRDELRELLASPLVQPGFAGAAARYLRHLEAGARLGAAGMLRALWWTSLLDVARAVLGERDLGWRFHINKNEGLALLGHLHRWALRLRDGEVSARIRDSIVDLPRESDQLRRWAVNYDIGELLDCEQAHLGIHGQRATVLQALTTERKGVRLVDESQATARAILLREAGIVVPALPPHVRPAVLPELAAFYDAVAHARAALPPGRSAFGSVSLDAQKNPPVIFLGHWHDQTSLAVTMQGAPQLVSSRKGLSDEAAGQAFDAALDLLAWPSADERAVLIRALTPRWAELLRALEQARPRTSAASVKPPRDERLAFRLVPAHGIELVLQKRAVRNKKGTLPAGLTDDGWTIGAATQRSSLPDSIDASDLAIVLRLHSRFETRAEWSVENLLALVEHPRCFLADGTRVRIEERRARISVAAHGDGNRIEVKAGDEILAAEQLRLLAYHDGSAIDDRARQDGRIVLTTVAREHLPILRALLAVGGDIPADGRDALLRALGPLEAAPHIDIDPRLLGEQLEPAPRVVARLTPDGDGLALALVVRALSEAAAFAPHDGPDRIVVTRDGVRAYCVRDRDTERALCNALADMLPLEQAAGDGAHGWQLAGDAACDVVAALRAPADAGDVVVEWPASSGWHMVDARAGALKLQVGGSPLTLHVQGEVVVDGVAVELVRLLDAARAGRRYVTLSTGRFLAIAEDLRAQVAALADAGTVDGDEVVGGAGLALVLDELKATGAHIEGNKVWTTWRARLAAAAAVDDRVPRGLDAELRPYQREGLRFLRRLVALESGGVLADDMGLGKTLQALALLIERAKMGPALVLAPTSVCFNWQREMERFAPGLRVRVLHEADDRSAMLAGLKTRDVLIASYGLLVREEEAFAARRFATLVIDEAQAIKNAASQRARATRRLDADVRIALTGTPLENHTGELWSIFQAVAPGLLPAQEEFRARFQAPIDRDRDPDRRRALARLIRPFLLRRKKAEVAPELPERTEIAVHISLTPAEREHYDALRTVLADKIRLSSSEPMQKRVLILSALTRLRQVACHPALDDTAGHWRDTPSSKLIALQRLVLDLQENRHRVLVFSQFTRLLDLCEPMLRKSDVSFVRLDGSTSPNERARAVDAFQGGDADVFLLSLKAGGFGLNLTAADYVIHLDPWWNPAAEAQASDRAHRIGQTRPVTIYRMVASGTLEEGVIAMQQSKRELFAGVLDGQDAVGARFGEAELMSLFEDAAAARAQTPKARASAREMQPPPP